jgi:hypothetical protein
MRTFNVTIRGTVHVVRCHSVRHPDDVTPYYRFLGSAGTVLWSWLWTDVTECVEVQRIEVHAEPSPMSGRSCGISF